MVDLTLCGSSRFWHYGIQENRPWWHLQSIQQQQLACNIIHADKKSPRSNQPCLYLDTFVYELGYHVTKCINCIGDPDYIHNEFMYVNNLQLHLKRHLSLSLSLKLLNGPFSLSKQPHARQNLILHCTHEEEQSTILNMMFNVTMIFFGWRFLWISEQILSWMMDESFHRLKTYLLLSTICDEILSWMIGFWMKDHLVSDNLCNIVNLYPPKKLQRMTNSVGLAFSVGNTTPRFTISIEKGN